MNGFRAARYILTSGFLAGALSMGFCSMASADTVWNPGDGTWNSKVIYLSRACHDGNDGIPGGPCITNTGCGDYSENSESAVMANTTTYGSGIGDNLLERGYRVVIGNGTLSENIANSNSRNISVHIPLHSNAQSESCGNTTNSAHGTWAMCRYAGQNNCGTTLSNKVGELSPGTNDQTVYTTGLGELNSINAVTCYLEAEFHTWNKGVNWLENEVDWTYKIGATVDQYLNFP